MKYPKKENPEQNQFITIAPKIHRIFVRIRKAKLQPKNKLTSHQQNDKIMFARYKEPTKQQQRDLFDDGKIVSYGI